LSAESGHAGRVTFGGAVDALEFLDALDVLVVPSLWEEPFGLVAVEGMARRLPVVATRSGALPELVADAGLVADAARPEEIAGALARVLADGGLRAELRRRGLARASLYTADRTAGRVLELLARVAGSPR